MGSAVSDAQAGAPAPARTIPVKIVIAGGFGVGKTTLVGAVSEIAPLTTEAPLTAAGIDVDDIRLVEGKTTTTVAMDFGRITLDHELVLYLFGTPGQERFWFMWDDLIRGAIGAIVLVDTRRLADSFAAVDYFEHRHIPFIVADNRFDPGRVHTEADLRGALAIGPEVPIIACDARVRESAKAALIRLVEHALVRRRQSLPTR